MMTAAEHVKAAEKLLQAETMYFNGGQTRRDFPPTLEQATRAQAHATLALVLVTGLATEDPNDD